VQREVLIWHDHVHETDEHARLYFWRLSFSPSYDRDGIFDRLRGVYQALGITSHVAYETLGEYDLLLRIWAPRSLGPEDIELRLWQDLREYKPWNINYLVCRTEIHWSDADKPPEIMPEDWPEADDPVIREVNDFNRAQWTSREPKARTSRIETFVGKGVLRPISLDTRGVRFFITFDHPRMPFSLGTRKTGLNIIKDKCREVLADWRSRDLDVEAPKLSLYEGVGTMSDFLVMARAPHGHFHEFVRDITIGLRTARLDDLFDMRPYTHVIADRLFSDFKEERVLLPDAEAIGFDFDLEETESLEFKATFSLNFRTRMAVGREEPDEAVTSRLVKSVCGLLNAPQGGTLAVGVLEVRRELERVKDKRAYLQKLQDDFGYPIEIPDDEAAITTLDLPNAVVGIEAEVGEGRLFSDQDKYARRVAQELRTTIRPNPWPYLTMTFPVVANRHLCVIKVRPADLWFYVKDGEHEDFYVREASSTVRLAGEEMDHFKQAHRRGRVDGY